MTTFSVDLAGKTSKPYGVGMRVVAGEVQIKPTAEAIHAASLDMKTIHTIQLNSNFGGTFNYAGSLVVAHAAVSEPGSYDNYASVVAYQFREGAGSIGTRTGTYTLQFSAIGE